MKKAKKNSPVATLQDLQEMTHFIVSTMNEMFSQQNKKIDKISGEMKIVKKRVSKLEQGQAKLEQGQAKLEQGQAKLEKNQAKLEKGQAEQLDISLQVVDELKTMREKQGAQTNHNARTNDSLESHDKRITGLEQSFATI